MALRYQYQHCRFWRVTVTLVVLLTCLRVWIGPVALVEPVQAQIPDSGMQRRLLLEETRRTNRLLTEIKQLLERYALNARIEGADNQADKPARTRGGGT